MITIVYKTAQITTSHRTTREEMRVRSGDAELVPSFKGETKQMTIQYKIAAFWCAYFFAKNDRWHTWMCNWIHFERLLHHITIT